MQFWKRNKRSVSESYWEKVDRRMEAQRHEFEFGANRWWTDDQPNVQHIVRFTMPHRDTFTAQCGAIDWSWKATEEPFAETTCRLCAERYMGLTETVPHV
jgi:hypothetical protein